MKKTMSYELLRGVTHLASGSVLTASGTTDDADVMAEIEALAEIKTASGTPQYIRILKDGGAGGVNAGVIKSGGTPEKPQEPEFLFKLPEGVNKNDVKTVQGMLEAGGLDFQSANALSDDDIKAQTTGVGDGRIKLIRAVGAANEYPEFKAQEQ